MKLKSKWTAEEIKHRLPANGGLGFLFHATDKETVSFAFEGADWTDDELWEEQPFIGSPIFFKNQVIGAHIIIPTPAELWATGHSGIRNFRRKQFLPALKLAEECGLNWLGLAALVPFATEFGIWGREHRSLFATTGHAATVAAIRQQVDTLGTELEFSPANMTYAIFGAAGSIGGNCARWFARTGLGKLLLIDRLERAHQVNALAVELQASGQCRSVGCHFSTELQNLPQFEVGIVATSNTAPWIDPDLMRRAPIWIDDSHPQAASSETEELLAGSVIYTECFLRGPHSLSQNFPFRLPTPRDCYACFGEVFLCWRAGMKEDFVIGAATLQQIAYADEQLRKLFFEVGPLTRKSGLPVSKKTLDCVRSALARRI